MRVSTRVHGYIDYAIGGLLVLAPLVLGLFGETPGTALLVAGVALVLNAAVTDMEAGLASRVHMPVHLWVDALIALPLGLSPWLFSFYRTVWAPHVAVALVVLVIAFLSHTVPGYERRRAR